jgi:hypothetical protein
LLPPQGLSTLGFDPARFQTKPPACYRASWQLPGRDSHPQATTSLCRIRSSQPTTSNFLAHVARDEDQASVGAQVGPTALLHPWKQQSRSRYRVPCIWAAAVARRPCGTSRPTRRPAAPVSGSRPPPGFLPALQPYWGTNRPFALRSGETCSVAAPPFYSEDPSSRFYGDAYECYLAAKRPTPEQEAIARFWSDDPGETATPPGHWISILTQLVRALALPLASAAEAYAKVGIAVADAFISCWSTKYRYDLLRPVTYVGRLIDPTGRRC